MGVTSAVSEHVGTSLEDVLAQVPEGILIGGVWSGTDASYLVRDPATEAPLSEVAAADSRQARAAVDAAAARRL